LNGRAGVSESIASILAATSKPRNFAANGESRLEAEARPPRQGQALEGDDVRRIQPAVQAGPHRVRLAVDPAEVDAYVADPLCGYDFSTQLVIDLLGGLAPLIAPSELARIPKRLATYVMSGARDPVGANLQSLLDAYRAAGLAVTARVYPDARHELLNETNRDEVAADLVAWLDGVLPRPGEPSLASAKKSAG
jgi:alpha-beta hydrolase superfamily lysophospholipase